VRCALGVKGAVAAFGGDGGGEREGHVDVLGLQAEDRLSYSAIENWLDVLG
jgi:hypothetical protein